MQFIALNVINSLHHLHLRKTIGTHVETRLQPKHRRAKRRP